MQDGVRGWTWYPASRVVPVVALEGREADALPVSGPQVRAQGPLRAGAARIDITPAAPVALEGYEDPEHRISEGVHDRLYARAFAFAAGNKRLVLVSIDVGSMVLGPYFQRAVLDRFDLQPDELFLCPIHTHSGPQLSLNPGYPHPNNFGYTGLFERQLVTLVGKALAALSPARVSVGRGTSAVGASRRKPMPDGRIVMAANPEGPADHELLVLQLARPDGEVFAALFNYACHSRSLRSPNRLVSGDVLGIAEQFLEERRRNQFVAAFPGASADIDPVSLADGFDASGSDTIPPPVRLGQRLGADVLSALQETRVVRAPAVIRTAARRVMLPARTGTAPRPINVVVAAVGTVAFVGLDCEASVEIGLAIKTASPFKDTFVFTICNGWRGYLPVEHQYAEGGYEVARTGFGPAAADILVKEALGMLAGLK